MFRGPMIQLDLTDFLAVAFIAILFYQQSKILKNLDKALELLTVQFQASSIEFYSNFGGQKKRITNMFLKVSEALPLAIEVKDKFGNLAKIEGAPQWALTDSTLATLEVMEGGMSAVLKPVGAVGSLKVQVSCDADLSEGVKTILGELEVELLAGEAVVVAITPGQAVPQ